MLTARVAEQALQIAEQARQLDAQARQIAALEQQVADLQAGLEVRADLQSEWVAFVKILEELTMLSFSQAFRRVVGRL